MELSAVGVRFDLQQVLRGIDLRVPHGQTLAVVGESGCGKTVLLKLLVGLIAPSVGQVRFDGKELAKLLNDLITQVENQPVSRESPSGDIPNN